MMDPSFFHLSSALVCCAAGLSALSLSLPIACLVSELKADACFRSRKAEKEHVTAFKEQIHKVQRAPSRRKINSSMVERLLLL